MNANNIFLDPSHREVVQRIRDAHGAVFALADKISDLLHRMLFAAKTLKHDEQQLLLSCLLPRALTAFQGAAILAENGLPSEARVVLRTLMEVTFRTVAIAKDESVARTYRLQDEVQRGKCLRKFQSLGEAIRGSVGPTYAQLREEIEADISARKIENPTTLWYADRAGMTDYYNSVYAVLSATVHVNVRELESSLVLDSEGNLSGLQYGPSDTELDHTLLTAFEAVLMCASAVFSVIDTELNSEFETLCKEYKTLEHELLPRT